jgi:hypothetical protein
MNPITLKDAVKLFSSVFIQPSSKSGDVISLPEITQRLQSFAQSFSPIIFRDCIPPSCFTGEDSLEQWQSRFSRNVQCVITLIWIGKHHNKNPASRVVYRAGKKARPGVFVGLQFYDAVIPGPPPDVPLVMASDLLIKTRVPTPASRAKVLGNATSVETFAWRKLESFRVGNSTTFSTLPETCVQLGVGGYGQVLYGRDASTQKDDAVKVFKGRLALLRKQGRRQCMPWT